MTMTVELKQEDHQFLLLSLALCALLRPGFAYAAEKKAELLGGGDEYRRFLELNREAVIPEFVDDGYLRGLSLFAWVGADELRKDERVGLKQALVPAGLIPMVAVERGKMDRADIYRQLEEQVERFGRPISLVQFKPAEVLKVIHGRGSIERSQD